MELGINITLRLWCELRLRGKPNHWEFNPEDEIYHPLEFCSITHNQVSYETLEESWS